MGIAITRADAPIPNQKAFLYLPFARCTIPAKNSGFAHHGGAIITIGSAPRHSMPQNILESYNAGRQSDVR